MSTRKSLRTIQPSANGSQRKLQVASDGLVKLGKLNEVENVHQSKLLLDVGTQLTRPFSRLDQENAHKQCPVKDVSCDFARSETNLPTTDKKSSTSNENATLPTIEEPSETSVLESSDTVNDELFKWMTEEIPPVGYWKELAEQRRVALEETLQENQDLYETIDTLNAKIDTLGIKLEAQNTEIATLNHNVESLENKLKLQNEEVKTLRVLADEAERLNAVLEELMQGNEVQEEEPES